MSIILILTYSCDIYMFINDNVFSFFLLSFSALIGHLSPTNHDARMLLGEIFGGTGRVPIFLKKKSKQQSNDAKTFTNCSEVKIHKQANANKCTIESDKGINTNIIDKFSNTKLLIPNKTLHSKIQKSLSESFMTKEMIKSNISKNFTGKSSSGICIFSSTY